MDLEFDDEKNIEMEHNPYISLTDNPEITYSDLKTKENGQEYITIYFETPTEDHGFCSMDLDYPNGIPSHIIEYNKEELSKLLIHYNKIGEFVFEKAKRNYDWMETKLKLIP